MASALHSQFGCSIVAIDRSAPSTPPTATGAFDAVQCDLCEATDPSSAAFGRLRAAIDGCDTVIHCAAWPGPAATPSAAAAVHGGADPSRIPIGLESASPWELLRDNVGSTLALCEASASAGVERFVFSSSAFAMGFSHRAAGPSSFVPRALPLSERSGGHAPHESYGLSKVCGESTLDFFAASTGASAVSIRFPNIVKRELWESAVPRAPPTAEDPLTLLLWAYAHEDDVVDAHVRAASLAAAAAAGAHEVYVAAAPDTRFREPTVPLLRSVLKMEPEQRRPLRHNASPLCSRKAERRLGMRFRSWQEREQAGGDEGGDGERGGSGGPLRELRRGGSASAVAALRDRSVDFFSLEGVEADLSQVPLPRGAALAYAVHGVPPGESLSSCGKPVVLLPTSFDAVHADFAYLIGGGGRFVLDTDRFAVVVANQLGNGVSFSPSNEDPRRPAPPFTIGDNVRAQKLLLDALGVQSLFAIYGYSMGALQGFDWCARYPDAVERLVAVCGASRCGDYNAAFLGSLDAALRADPTFVPEEGRFAATPSRGLEAFSRVYAGWGVGKELYLDRRFEAFGHGSGEAFVRDSYLPAFAGADADDLLAQIGAWRSARVPCAGAAEIAVSSAEAERLTRERLRAVRARVLLMPCESDRYFTVEEARREAEWIGARATLRALRSDLGHRAGDPHREGMEAELEALREATHAFLAD